MGKIKEWLLNLAAKRMAKKLNLQEGTPMENGKQWYKSKTVISGILVVLFGSYDLARASLAPAMGWNLPEIPPFVYTVLGTMGVYGRMTAEKKIG